MLEMNRKKGIFLLIDALFALTLALLISLTVAVFSQSPDSQLVQLHQLGRDFLVLQHKQSVAFDFSAMTGFNSTSRTAVSSSVIAYPRLCASPGVTDCFASQDVFEAGGARKALVFNTTVSP
ncbi:MAG TPA: hypothetical protein VI875_01005 [Candidatus Norongarragalinales archaeon]|nr:hypothetical protein [Candidatus Norongarragalinales archaeon]